MIYFILFSILSGMAKAVSDTLAYHYDISIFQKWGFNRAFWDSMVSWRNKYANIDVSRKEKFFLSSTVLVWLTDGWHLFNAVQRIGILGVLMLLPNLPPQYPDVLIDSFLKAIGYLSIHFACFTLFFNYILVLKLPFFKK